MKLIPINPPSTITEPQIPDVIARDSEVTAAINAHIAAADPHPSYLTQSEGDGRYRQTATALTDSDIPAVIARDSEVTAAIAAHIAATDPHPTYLLKTEKATDSELIDGIDSSQIVYGSDWSRANGNLNINETIHQNSGFFDCWQGGTFPPGIEHLYGFQARHRNPTSVWGMQAGCQHNFRNEFYFRTISGGEFQPWRRIWNEGNFNPNYHAHTFDGLTAKSIGYSGGTFFSETNNCGYEIQSRDSSSAAYVSFHRPSIFACHFGIDVDNQLKVGGWSFGGNSYKIWHEGNFNPAQTTRSKLITGNCPSTAANDISISHGLDVTKIVGYTFMAFCPARGWVLSESTAIGVSQFVHCQLGTSTNFLIRVGVASSSSGIYGQPFKILVFYTE